MRKFTFRAQTSGERLDQVLDAQSQSAGWNLSKHILRQAIIMGFVYVNGKKSVSPGLEIKQGGTIDLYLNDKFYDLSKSNRVQNENLRILYEDEAIICFDKPAALPTQPTVDAKRSNLYDLARNQLARQLSVDEVYLGMHHRLDRDTSGVILFTKHQDYNKFIAAQFADHLCSKLYVAVVHGKLARDKGRLESYLGSLGKTGPKKMQKFGSMKSGGKKAITEFVVLDSNKKYSLVEVAIKTGRTHQIRVHFSEMGHPVVGDTLYGSPEKEYQNLRRHLLHAHALTIEHPVTHNQVRIESPVPDLFRSLMQGS